MYEYITLGRTRGWEGSRERERERERERVDIHVCGCVYTEEV